MSSAPEERLRLFVSFDVPQPQLAALHDGLEGLRSRLPDARWIPPAEGHVTVKFIGSIPESRLSQIAGVCEHVATRFERLTVRLEGLGAFPSLSRARVLWAGIADGSGVIRGLAEGLDIGLADLGVPAERRSFTPHLTLARFKAPTRLADLPPLPEIAEETFVVPGFALMRSHLSGVGARYQVVERFTLGSSV